MMHTSISCPFTCGLMVTSDVPFSVALYFIGSVMSLLLMVMVGYDVGVSLGTSKPQAVRNTVQIAKSRDRLFVFICVVIYVR